MRGSPRPNPMAHCNLLVVFLTVAVLPGVLVDARRSQLAAKPVAPSITAVLAKTSNVTAVQAAVAAAGLGPVLSGNGSYTVFVPVDSAFNKSLTNITCVNSYQVTKPCGTVEELLSSLGLQTLLLNHVVGGRVNAANLKKLSSVQTLGGATQGVTLNGSSLYIGTAKVVKANVAASNGVIHLIDDVLYSDSSFNATTVALHLKNFADLGPDSVSDVSFNATQLETMVGDNRNLLNYYRSYRPVVAGTDGGWTYAMPLTFDPTLGNNPCAKADGPDTKWDYVITENVTRPDDDEDLAFMTVMELASLIRSKQISSVELTQLYQARLRKYDSLLQATVTFTDELAMNQSMAADALLASGTYLGPLHGIPYGLKDLIAVPPYRTTWGSGAFVDQVIPYESHVYTQLKNAGAVLVAKLVTGEMATGNQWWGGNTRSPWNIAVGASGSSAGPGAAVSAGMVGFAIGTETGGSIIGPSATNGIAGLRPTLGVVGRSNCMALAQTYDKLGPMTRSAMDAAVVFDVIRGKDTNDQDTCNYKYSSPFEMDISNFTVGVYNSTEFNVDSPVAADVLSTLEGFGVTLIPINFNYSISDRQMSGIYEVTRGAEAAAYFDNWLRSGNIANNTAQDAWPVRLRRSRMIPAVEYVQATRTRGVLTGQYLDTIRGLDAWVGDAGGYTSIGNIANFPEITVPMGFAPATTPSGYNSITPRKSVLNVGFYGQPYGEDKILALAIAYQSRTSFNKERPPIDQIEPELLVGCNTTIAGTGARCTISADKLAKLNETGIGNKPTVPIMY